MHLKWALVICREIEKCELSSCSFLEYCYKILFVHDILCFLKVYSDQTSKKFIIIELDNNFDEAFH